MALEIIGKTETSEVGAEAVEHSSSSELVQSLKKNYLALLGRHGKKAADLMMERIMDNPHDKRAFSGVDRFSTIEEAKKTAFTELESMGVFRLSPEGLNICDVDRMKTALKDTESKKRLGPIYTAKHLGDQKLSKTLALLFEGTRVVSNEDYKKGIKEPKDLFYLPKNAEDALDLKKIRSSDFYLTLYDVAKPGSYGGSGRYKETKYGNVEDLDYREVLLPVFIYHPKYGRGHRDEKTGELFVFDLGSETPKKISSHFFSRNFGSAFGNDSVPEESLGTPRLFVKKHLPRIAEKGLLLPEDFGISTGTSTSRFDRVSKRPRIKGVVMFNGVDHNIGKIADGKDIIVYQIAPHLGGVVKEDETGQKKLIATFTIFGKAEELKGPGGYYRAGVEKTNAVPFEPETFYQKRGGESDEAFRERIRLAEDFNNLLELSDYLLREAEINLSELDFRQQQQIVAIAKKYGFKDNPRFLRFAKEYREEGLKTFAVMEQEENLGEKIFQISEKIDPKAAYQIFRRYNKLITTAGNLEVELVDLFRDEEKVSRMDIDNIRQRIIRKANHLLLDFAEKVQKGKRFSLEELLQSLEKYETYSILTASAYREAKKYNIEYREMAGTEYQQSTAREICRNKKAWAQMSNMYWNNWSHKPALRKLLVQGFNEKIEKGGNDTVLHIYRQGNNIEAFCRTDRTGPNQIYFASLNVSPSVQGSALGWALREAILKLYAEQNDITAECDPSDPKSTSEYIEHDGFAVTEIFSSYEGTGEFIFKILRKRGSPKYALQEISREDFTRRCADSLGEGMEDKTILLKFKPGSREIREVATYLVNKKGYRITRYFFSSDRGTVFCGFERLPEELGVMDEAAA